MIVFCFVHNIQLWFSVEFLCVDPSFHWRPASLFRSHPLSSHHVCQRDMVSLLMDWKFMVKKVPCSWLHLSLSGNQNKVVAAYCAAYGRIRISHQSVPESPRASFRLCSPWQGVVCVALLPYTPRFYPQMDVSLVKLLLPECIIPLNFFFKLKSFYWPVFGVQCLLTCVGY